MLLLWKGFWLIDFAFWSNHPHFKFSLMQTQLTLVTSVCVCVVGHFLNAILALFAAEE